MTFLVPALNTEIRICESLTDIPAKQWDALAGDNPFLSHCFFLSLQESGCAVENTGWQPRFLTHWQDDCITGAMPMYLKPHSYGEFVFDWAWADAYQRHGLNYYPKLVSAVPFTPVTGPRVLGESAGVRVALLRAALDLAVEAGLSSLHVLFPTLEQAEEMQQMGLMLRQGVQFHWKNPGYTDFADYLSAMSHEKRNKIRQERRRVADAGIKYERISGKELSEEQWSFFFRCYEQTHRQYRSPIPLNRDFFRRIGEKMPENILLVVASREGVPIASALNFLNRHTLFGRSWGTLEYHPGLHFETCYYQAIEYCIEQRLAVFEGGAQGEHKLARGFLPTPTWSAHWLPHPEFSRAVEEFLRRESLGVAHYVDELNDHNPFKKGE